MKQKDDPLFCLTPLRQRFVLEYVKCGDHVQSARIAGYKGNIAQSGQKALDDPRVQTAIKHLLKPDLHRAKLTRRKTHDQLVNYMFRSIKDFIGSDGYLIGNPKDLSDAAAQCVESWEVYQHLNEDGEVTGQTVKVKLVSKGKMQELAMKFMKMLGPETQNNNTTNVGVAFNWEEFFGSDQPTTVEGKLKEVEGT